MTKSSKNKNKSLSIYHSKEIPLNDNFIDTVKQTQIDVWRSQMLPVLRVQYKTEPDKVRNADTTKNADYFIANPMIKLQMRMFDITRNDIILLMETLKREVLKSEIIEAEIVKRND